MEATRHWIATLDMEGFSERLKHLRQARGLSQTRLAELLDTLPRSYNRWERGGTVPQAEMLVKIADALQVSVDELLGRRDAITEPKIRNPDLHQLVQEVDELPDEEQRALIVVMDGLVRSSRVAKAANRRRVARPASR
jgi:transcriptional regulator with XRE-family HTH domain